MGLTIRSRPGIRFYNDMISLNRLSCILGILQARETTVREPAGGHESAWKGRTAMHAFDDDAFLELCLGHAADASGTDIIHVLRRGDNEINRCESKRSESERTTHLGLDTPAAAELFVPGLLPLCDQAGVARQKAERER
jgi:hypothetical protein